MWTHNGKASMKILEVLLPLQHGIFTTNKDSSFNCKMINYKKHTVTQLNDDRQGLKW
jgi:hypothetical protein